MTYALRALLVLGFLSLNACANNLSAPSETPADDDGDEASDERDAASRAEAGSAGRRDAGDDEPELDASAERDAATPVRDDGASATEDAEARFDARAPEGDATGSLPAVTDLTMAGPYTPTRGAGPLGFVLFYPEQLGKDGVKHPIVSWGPGAAENAGSFTSLLNHYASHGFVVISYDGTPNGQELVTAIDWLLAENERSASMFHQKLDTSKIAAGGHSAGSLATFRIAADARLTTTMHLCGGTFDPHTDIENLRAPALFLCGEAGGDGLLFGDVARPNCDIDFENATVPVVYGIPKGASHMSPTEIGDPVLRSKFAAATLAWLRWQLAADETQRAMFLGSACTLCKDASWTLQQKNWP